ncbi:MAG: PH domain-containing protein [Candidatus Magasanikbacteria bacterium]|nr:PH domain-containing protein [Candidatus Magasanikbacteria bacterium]
MNIPLKENEKILLTLRKSLWAYAGQIFGICLLIGAPFFFMFRLFQIERWGVYLFASPIVIAFFLIARIIFLWRSNILLVTSDRIIDFERTGLFNRELHEIGWNKIQSIGSEVKGAWATIFHIGVIKFETSAHGQEYDFESHPLRNSDAIQIQLSHILESYEQTHGSIGEEGHLERALESIAYLSAKEIEDVQDALLTRQKILNAH